MARGTLDAHELESMMTVQLDHLMVPSRNKMASAKPRSHHPAVAAAAGGSGHRIDQRDSAVASPLPPEIPQPPHVPGKMPESRIVEFY